MTIRNNKHSNAHTHTPTHAHMHGHPWKREISSKHFCELLKARTEYNKGIKYSSQFIKVLLPNINLINPDSQGLCWLTESSHRQL